MAAWRRLGLCLALAWAAGSGPVRAEAEPSLAETQRRNNALVQQGFNLTLGLRLSDAQGQGRTVQRSLLIPPGTGPTQLHLWAAAAQGELKVDLQGPGARPLLSWQAGHGQQDLRTELPPGRYELRIDSRLARDAWGLLGIKGAAVALPQLDPNRYQWQEAAPERGFHSAYLLYQPRELTSRHLLVAPNNSGFASADPELLSAAASAEAQGHQELADALGAPLLVPSFPRPPVGADDNLYLHALSRAALQTQAPAAWRRVDLQLLAMVDDALERLARQGHPLERQVLLRGFSASGMFVNRFALLHPERVLAVASGSPGGWPVAPVSAWRGQALPYPVGLGDLPQLVGRAPDSAALRRVHWWFFVGAEDLNDSVTFRDSFSVEHEALVMAQFGATPPVRWPRSEALYREQGLKAEFKSYPGLAHQVNPEMQADILGFFRRVLARP